MKKFVNLTNHTFFKFNFLFNIHNININYCLNHNMFEPLNSNE